MNVNVMETAKDLVRKGTLLNDPELIKMGNDLLDSLVDPIKLHKVEVPTYEINSSIGENPNYKCSNCGHKMYSEKPRKRCPECKKHQLKSYTKIIKTVGEKKPELMAELKEKVSNQVSVSDFIMPTSDASKNRIRYDENGEVVGTYTKSESVQPFKNGFEDDGNSHKKDKKFTKTVEFELSPRRPMAKQIKVECEKCKKEFKTNSANEYMCSRCITKGSRR